MAETINLDELQKTCSTIADMCKTRNNWMGTFMGVRYFHELLNELRSEINPAEVPYGTMVKSKSGV